MTEKDKVPFYKELYNKIENELGLIDTIAGLGLGLGVGIATCLVYWVNAYKYH